MHQIRFWLGSAPDPAEGTCDTPPDSQAGFKGAYFYGKERRERGELRKSEVRKCRVPPHTFEQVNHCL